MKVAFIVPYPIGKAPSQRFRFEQQFENLKANHVTFELFPFLTDKAFNNLYQQGKYFSKGFSIILGFIKRFFLLFQLGKFDFVFIHREASPIGPPIFEYLIAKLLKKKIIYDFDDAIWLPNTSSANKIVAKLKWHQKVNSISAWSYKVSCGNEYLAGFAQKFNSKVEFVPTSVDMELMHNKTKDQNTEKLIIGWTGTHSTISYLYEIEDLLTEKQKELGFEFEVISNKDPKFKHLKYQYVPWNKSSEIEDLLNFNIGIMPLKDDLWAKGKCGFKAIQYMSLGIPAIASDVGVNSEVVDHKINGFICASDKDWNTAIDTLVNNSSLRKEFGEKAQEKIKTNYSKSALKTKYLNLFNLTV